jgi:hypothetical protein
VTTAGSGALGRRRRPSIDALIFDLVLIVFTAVIVVAALDGSPRAGLVPLVVGIPTLLGLGIQLAHDLLAPRTAEAEPTEVPISVPTAGVGDLIAAAHVEEVADDQLPSTPEARRAQIVLTAWALGFVVLGIATSFLIATPVALLVILLVTTRRIVPTVAITAVASGLLYLIFDVVLNVAF